MNETGNDAIDTLVIGAGPTGTALAIDLVRRGLHVPIVDKAAHAFTGSRAKGVQPRTLEVLDDLGALDEVLAGGSTYPLLGVHLGPLTIPWRMFSNRQPTADVPFPNTWLIPQYRTDRALHTRLHTLGTRVEFGKELVELAPGDTTITATLETAEGLEQITARYVVGADGGSSNVRRHLGIDFAGSTDEQDRIIIADAVVTGLSRERWHVWPGRRGSFMSACPLPHSDLFQWIIRLAPEQQPLLDRTALTKRIHTHTHDTRIQLQDVRWTSVFRPNIRLADSYRVGRVFLAGDAAHVHTPAGAQGLNTGIQDAYNLGWKLAQVLAGADDRLLDTYEAERLPIAAAVLGLSTKKYNGLSTLDPSSIRRGKDEQQLGISYLGGPLAPSGGERTKTLRVGDRAPDAEMLGARGERVRLFSRFRGPHFTAIAYGEHAAEELARIAWPSAGAPLQRMVIDRAASGDTFRRAYGVTDNALLLIRPDGHVGHIANHDMLGMRAAIQTMTPNTQPGAHTR